MDLNSTKLKELTFGHFIRLIREVALLLVIGTVFLKLMTGEFGLDFTKLSASELVSILLAFFSIGLSATFYFAATIQSNQFYDNVNKFSKDTSELLGRLDEQLKGIGGKQTELRESLDRYYRGGTMKHIEEEKEVTVKKAKQVELDLSMLFQRLLEHSTLSKPEQDELQSKLKEKDSELINLRQRLARFDSNVEFDVRKYTRNRLKKMGLSNALSYQADELLFRIADQGPLNYKRDLEFIGFLTTSKPTSPLDVTDIGKQMVESELERLVSNEGVVETIE